MALRACALYFIIYKSIHTGNNNQTTNYMTIKLARYTQRARLFSANLNSSLSIIFPTTFCPKSALLPPTGTTLCATTCTPLRVAACMQHVIIACCRAMFALFEGAHAHACNTHHITAMNILVSFLSKPHNHRANARRDTLDTHARPTNM